MGVFPLLSLLFLHVRGGDTGSMPHKCQDMAICQRFLFEIYPGMADLTVAEPSESWVMSSRTHVLKVSNLETIQRAEPIRGDGQLYHFDAAQVDIVSKKRRDRALQ